MVLSALINGLTLSALLFIMAIGLNLSFGLLRVVNLSHGAFYLFGGYVGLSVLKMTGSWLLALLAGSIASGLLALAEEFFLLRRARGKPTIETLITLSVAIILSDLIVVFWGGNPKVLSIPKYLKGFVTFVEVNIPIYNIFIFMFALLLGITFWLVINKTRIGMTIRAGVDNFEMVAALGINIQRLFTLVFSLAGFLAGTAGVIGGTFLMVAPGEDWRILTYALLIMIIGGMSSFGGTVLGSLIIGMIFSFGSIFVPQLYLFIMFAPVAVVLVVRPQGLFGRAL
jgi:branched-chain amino acid transport system permease protein